MSCGVPDIIYVAQITLKFVGGFLSFRARIWPVFLVWKTGQMSERPVKCGEPQGTLLGHLLFNIFLNDLNFAGQISQSKLIFFLQMVVGPWKKSFHPLYYWLHWVCRYYVELIDHCVLTTEMIGLIGGFHVTQICLNIIQVKNNI